jgi:hypothetical protein
MVTGYNLQVINIDRNRSPRHVQNQTRFRPLVPPALGKIPHHLNTV